MLCSLVNWIIFLGPDFHARWMTNILKIHLPINVHIISEKRNKVFLLSEFIPIFTLDTILRVVILLLHLEVILYLWKIYKVLLRVVPFSLASPLRMVTKIVVLRSQLMNFTLGDKIIAITKLNY